MRPIRTYSVKVEGYPAMLYSARSPQKALVRCWHDYQAAYDLNYKGFLKIARVSREQDPEGIGRRIMVGGQPATVVIGHGQYVCYMPDDSDVILRSHPADVQEIAARVA